MSSKKREPQRTCVACRNSGDKRSLVRLVRLSGGGVVVDGHGRLPGRGAYLCPSAECWRAGMSGDQLESVLKTSLSQADRDRLWAEAQAVIGGT